MYAATQPGIQTRGGPLFRALRDARGLDPELAKVWDDMEAWRRRGQGQFAELLASRGALRPGLLAEEAGDIVYALCSLSVHDMLVLERKWSLSRYGEWLADALKREILPQTSRRRV